MKTPISDDGYDPDKHRGQVERRHGSFVPDPYRVVYPVDHHTSRRHALAKFDAETRVEVGGQLTRRMIRHVSELEDEIRYRACDGAHYTLMAAALTTYMADAIEVRHRYMIPDDNPRNFR